jgi:hypothetical protein
MSLIPPVIVLTVGTAMLVVAFRVFARKALPELDDAQERVKTSPEGRVANLPWTISFLAAMVGGVGFMAIGLLWVLVALAFVLFG